MYPPERNPEFENFIRAAMAKNLVSLIIGIVILSLLGLYFFGYGLIMVYVPLIIFGLLLLGGVGLALYRYRGYLRGADYWIDQIVLDPNRIVWITPVHIRDTPGSMFSIEQEMDFQILNVDGLKVLIKCKERKERLLFLYGLKHYVPHAHFGFSDRVEFYYKANRFTFLYELHAQNLYKPIFNLDIG